MRIALALPLLLLASACNVSKDEGNGTMTVQYDQNTAENAVADVANTAQNVAADIGNDVQRTGDKIQEKTGNADVDVNVDANVSTNKQ